VDAVKAMPTMGHLMRSASLRSALVLVMACASPHPSLVSAPARDDEPTPAAPRAGSGRSPIAITNACTNAALPPAFEDAGSGVRAAIPASSFDTCAPIDLDGTPPCEVACTIVAPAPDYRSGEDGRSPNFHVLGHTVYFAPTSPAKELGRIVTYDGPLDAANPRHAADRTTVAFVDHQTSPPTLELRAGSCLFPCNRPGTLVGDPPGKRESDCRAACPPVKRYRYDGKRLRPVR
jgi:hypothetical protein